MSLLIWRWLCNIERKVEERTCAEWITSLQLRKLVVSVGGAETERFWDSRLVQHSGQTCFLSVDSSVSSSITTPVVLLCSEEFLKSSNMDPCVPIPMDNDKLMELVDKAKDYCLMHGECWHWSSSLNIVSRHLHETEGQVWQRCASLCTICFVSLAIS